MYTPTGCKTATKFCREDRSAIAENSIEQIAGAVANGLLGFFLDFAPQFVGFALKPPREFCFSCFCQSIGKVLVCKTDTRTPEGTADTDREQQFLDRRIADLWNRKLRIAQSDLDRKIEVGNLPRSATSQIDCSALDRGLSGEFKAIGNLIDRKAEINKFQTVGCGTTGEPGKIGIDEKGIFARTNHDSRRFLDQSWMSGEVFGNDIDGFVRKLRHPHFLGRSVGDQKSRRFFDEVTRDSSAVAIL